MTATMGLYEIKIALSLLSSLLFGTPEDNFQHCVANRTAVSVCRDQFRDAIYWECMFWCLDAHHCNIGAQIAVEHHIHTRESTKRLEELQGLMEESWNNGGCGSPKLYIIDDTGLYYPIRRQTPKTLIVEDPTDNTIFRVNKSGKVLRSHGRKPNFGKDPVIVRM